MNWQTEGQSGTDQKNNLVHIYGWMCLHVLLAEQKWDCKSNKRGRKLPECRQTFVFCFVLFFWNRRKYKTCGDVCILSFRVETIRKFQLEYLNNISCTNLECIFFFFCIKVSFCHFPGLWLASVFALQSFKVWMWGRTLLAFLGFFFYLCALIQIKKSHIVVMSSVPSCLLLGLLWLWLW